ncbi:putative methyltransferase [Cucumispora dikerogammari]|nr:putative methyltransferase [Cucumispora dikerogammari]
MSTSPQIPLSDHDKPTKMKASTINKTGSINNQSDLNIDSKVESTYVQQFYSSTAASFSSTRYKPWPKIISFYQTYIIKPLCAQVPTETLETSHVFSPTKYLLNILDSGTGNGRNTLYPETICTDTSLNLLKINPNSRKILSNIKQDIFKPETFDFIFSIAVIHHVISFEERNKVLKNYYSLLKPNNKSKMLIYVWAFEKVHTQTKFKKMNSYLNTNKYNERDYLCDWKNSGKLRYYYLYKLNEFELELRNVGFIIREIGFDGESIFSIVSRS